MSWRRLAGILFATLWGTAAAAAPEPVPAVKTLEDIRIEGEIRLPRVLFITSRDTERPLDFLDDLVAPEDAAPDDAWIPVVGSIPALDEVPKPPLVVTDDGGAPSRSTESIPAAGPAPTAPPETNDAPEEIHP